MQLIPIILTSIFHFVACAVLPDAAKPGNLNKLKFSRPDNGNNVLPGGGPADVGFPRRPGAGGIENFDPNARNRVLQNAGRAADIARGAAAVPGQSLSERLSTSRQCSEDYLKICSHVSRMNNFAVLECLQNSNKQTQQELTQECNQHLWSYKKNVTEDKRFREAATSVCRTELLEKTCAGIKGGPELLSCLIENSEAIQSTHCRQFVNRMAVITFSDYRLMRGFYEKCTESVTRTKCGDVHGPETEAENYDHLQGSTIQCLEKSMKIVDPACRAEILRVAELSADDYHRDRALYFACRDDRERFCESVLAGDGRVYKCLMDHKKEKRMSEECMEALTVRQKVIAKDVRADKSLLKHCKPEIKSGKCLLGRIAETKEATLSALLLCLEGQDTLSGECQAELFDIRKSLMEDYKVNPEVVTGCADDIKISCGGLRREGKTLHCLMERAMKHNLTGTCKSAVRHLLREVKAGSDYRLDPYLTKVCTKSIGALCSKMKGGNAKVLSCLMDNVDSDLMDSKCAANLFELQYFISRDFKLDPNLNRNCLSDVKQYCRELDEPDRSAEVFHCLHNHLHDKAQSLSQECSTQIHRALRQRAASVSLNPSVEKKCRQDLGRLCAADIEKEFSCLQNHFKELDDECKEVVAPFIEEESEDVRMNKALMKACSPMLKKYCKEELKKKVDEGDALDCLINHKGDPEMEPKCAAGIEHFQIVLLTDYTLTFKFKQACKEDVSLHCQNAGKSKDAVLACLSKLIRDKILTDEPQVISASCRAQVKFEMLHESEDIQLDPGLYKACEQDLSQYCAKRSTEDQLECLRRHDQKLSKECYREVFDKEKELQERPDWDFNLMKWCEKEIEAYCKTSKDNIIECLHDRLREPGMGQGCKEVMFDRLREQGRDIELNPTMRRVCVIDMGKFCGKIREEARLDRKMDLPGKMIACLQEHLFKDDDKLMPLCEKYVRHFTMETALNYELDAQLKKACGATAKKRCSEVLLRRGDGLVIECLKDLAGKDQLTDPQCKKQIAKLTMEGIADIHVDPPLAEACALDLKHYCNGVMQGQGQQMACLLEALEDSTIKLQKACKKMLSERKELWEFAAEVVPPDTLGELYLQMNRSPSRHYFLLSILSFIAGILFFGFCCGRATKHVTREVKTK